VGTSASRAAKRSNDSSSTASRIPSLPPKWCCTAPQVTPARRVISFAVVFWKPISAMLSTTARMIRSRVAAVTLGLGAADGSGLGHGETGYRISIARTM
jgi:hypothetical protein